MLKDAYIALGANLGDKVRTFNTALSEINTRIGPLCKVSKFYTTAPLNPPGIDNQPVFLNAVAIARTELSADEILMELEWIERLCGRTRAAEIRWGPRSLDLDLLFLGSEVLDSASITLPHPEIQNRTFVLAPLAEIAPDFVHPVAKKKVSTMLQDLLERLEASAP